MRIGELAERSGASVRSLRYYEEQGLLAPERSAGGQRHFAEWTVERVVLIRQLFHAGLSSRTIADLMPCVDAQQSTPESRARLRRERDRLDTQIRELVAARDRLDAVIVEAENSAGSCSVIRDDAGVLAPV